MPAQLQEAYSNQNNNTCCASVSLASESGLRLQLRLEPESAQHTLVNATVGAVYSMLFPLYLSYSAIDSFSSVSVFA
jgi:hypothetical protein